MKRKFLTCMISYTAEINCKRRLEWDLNAIQARMYRCFDSITEPSSEKHEEKISNMISYIAQVKCRSWLERDLNAIQVRMCSVSILLQNHPQRNMKRKFLTWFLTLPNSSVKVDSSETWTRTFAIPVQGLEVLTDPVRNFLSITALRYNTIFDCHSEVWKQLTTISKSYNLSFSVCRYFGGDEAHKKHMYTFWHGRLAEFFEHCEDFDRKSEVVYAIILY